MFRNPGLADQGHLSPKKNGPYVYIGPDGVPLTPSDLPSANTIRWVIRRKAIVVGAVETGMIGLDDACSRYNLSVEELTGWRQALEEFGLIGLMTTKLKMRRSGQSAALAEQRHRAIVP